MKSLIPAIIIILITCALVASGYRALLSAQTLVETRVNELFAHTD
jgi:hypothetical protein